MTAKYIQGKLVNDDDWYLIHKENKTLSSGYSPRSGTGREIDMKAGWANNPFHFSDTHMAAKGRDLDSLVKKGVIDNTTSESVVVMSDYKLDRRGRKYKAHRHTMGRSVKAMDVAKAMRKGSQPEMSESINPYEEILAENEFLKIAKRHLQDSKRTDIYPAQREYAKEMHRRALEASKIPNQHKAVRHYMGMDDTNEDVQIDEISKGKIVDYIANAAKDVGYHANLTGFVAGQKKPKGFNPTEDSPTEIKRHKGIQRALKKLTGIRPIVKEDIAEEEFKLRQKVRSNAVGSAGHSGIITKLGKDKHEVHFILLGKKMVPAKDLSDDTHEFKGNVYDRSSVKESRLIENIEDEHSEVHGEFHDHIKKVKDPEFRKSLKADFEKAMKGFAKAYDRDDGSMMGDHLEDMKTLAKQAKKAATVAESFGDVQEISKKTVSQYLNKTIDPVYGMVKTAKNKEELLKRLKGVTRAHQRITGKAPTSEEVEQVDEISKATATSYVRKKLSQIAKRPGDANMKDVENLGRAYKRMGVSDKAMKEEIEDVSESSVQKVVTNPDGTRTVVVKTDTGKVVSHTFKKASSINKLLKRRYNIQSSIPEK